MDDLLGVISILALGRWFWLGVALGLGGAGLAWTYLPPTMDRTSVAAWIFVIGCILEAAVQLVGEKKK
jgi:hypothetical protein